MSTVIGPTIKPKKSKMSRILLKYLNFLLLFSNFNIKSFYVWILFLILSSPLSALAPSLAYNSCSFVDIQGNLISFVDCFIV